MNLSKYKGLGAKGKMGARNRMLATNILFSGILKVLSLLSSLLIVPVTIGYLDNEIYGIWLTITSVMFWINTMDIGLGNGMRNYLAQALSKGDYALGRRYITTTLALLSLLAIAMGAVAVFPMETIDFRHFFNTQALPNEALRDALGVAVAFTLLHFVVKNVGMVFVAMQKYALSDLLSVVGNLLALAIVYLCTLFATPRLLYVVLAYTATPAAIYLLAALPLFAKYPQLRPSWGSFDKSLGRQIVGKGLGFFLIQMSSCLVIFGAGNLFITQYCGPEAVTTYNVAYKYFNLLVIAYTIVLAPMWNAYTDAYVKGDMAWIATNFGRALKLWALSLVGGAAMLALSHLFYHIWVGDKVDVPFSVSLCTLGYVSMFNLNNCVTYLLNGLNKIRVQIITSLLGTLLYVAAVMWMGGSLGVEGIVGCMAASYALMALVHLYQCRLMIRGKAKGIWDK